MRFMAVLPHAFLSSSRETDREVSQASSEERRLEDSLRAIRQRKRRLLSEVKTTAEVIHHIQFALPWF